jgi:hypothetical protein
MSRPKKEFIPTSLSDLNIDTISLGSNGDRHNNNSNGARFNNLDRSSSKSSYNLASYQKSLHNNSDNNFSRSKTYGSQLNLSSQSVNNFSINSPSSGNVDRWEQAWEDNNNIYRPPSYHTQAQKQREHSFDKSNKHPFDFKHSQTTSKRSTMNHYIDDPFEDPWSGISSFSSSVHKCSLHLSTHPAVAFIIIVSHPTWWWEKSRKSAARYQILFLFVCLTAQL